MSKPQRRIMTVGIGSGVVLLLTFLFYWFAGRPWEERFYWDIIERSNAVIEAASAGDYEATIDTAWDLDEMLGNRIISNPTLAARVSRARNAAGEAYRSERDKRQRLAEERRPASAESTTKRDRVGHSSGAFNGFTEDELAEVHARLMRDGYSFDEALLKLKSMLDYPDTRAVMRRWLDNR